MFHLAGGAGLCINNISFGRGRRRGKKKSLRENVESPTQLIRKYILLYSGGLNKALHSKKVVCRRDFGRSLEIAITRNLIFIFKLVKKSLLAGAALLYLCLKKCMEIGKSCTIG